MSQYTPTNAALASFFASTTALNQAILSRWQPESSAELLGVLSHGAASWAPSGFVYNHDLEEFYESNSEGIRGMLQECQQDSGYPTILSMVCAWCPEAEPMEVESALYIDGYDDATQVIATIILAALTKCCKDFVEFQEAQG